MTGIKNLVSIVLPFFNGKEFIAETIDSIISQTYTNFELLVIDDGSSDNNQSIFVENLIRSYSDRRLKYCYKSNGGLSDARNVGINNAAGEFIAFIDQDDLWDRDKLTKQVSVFNRNEDVVFICTDGEVFGEVNKDLEYRKRIKHQKGLVRNSYAQMIKNNIVIASSAIFRKSIIQNIGYSNKTFIACPDYEYFIRISKAYDFYFIPEPLTKYRLHMHNTVKNIVRLNCEQVIVLSQQDLSTFLKKYYALRQFILCFLRCLFGFISLSTK